MKESGIGAETGKERETRRKIRTEKETGIRTGTGAGTGKRTGTAGHTLYSWIAPPAAKHLKATPAPPLRHYPHHSVLIRDHTSAPTLLTGCQHTSRPPRTAPCCGPTPPADSGGRRLTRVCEEALRHHLCISL